LAAILAGDVVGFRRLTGVDQEGTLSRLPTTPLAEPKESTLAPPDKPSIAVLPFQNMSDDPDQDYVADGLSEDLITALSTLKWFFVIAWNSCFPYKGNAVDAKQAAAELGVRYILDGSVRKDADRVCITAQLTDAETGIHVWAESYDRSLAEIFTTEDEITASVVATIVPQLYLTEAFRTKHNPPENLNAWECVVRALGVLNTRTRVGTAVAKTLLQEAIAGDATYARAYALLAYATALEAVCGWEPFEKTLMTATEAANKAALLDVDDPWAHFAMGYLARDHEAAVDAIDRAIALNPNSAMAWNLSGWLRSREGDGDAAIACFQHAIRLSPLDPFGFTTKVGLGWAQFVAGRYEEATACADAALRQRPNLVIALRLKLAACSVAGRVEEAEKAKTKVLALQPDALIRERKAIPPFRRTEHLSTIVREVHRAGLPE